MSDKFVGRGCREELSTQRERAGQWPDRARRSLTAADSEIKTPGHRALCALKRPDGRKRPVYSRPRRSFGGGSRSGRPWSPRGTCSIRRNRSTVPSMTEDARFLHSLCVCVLMMDYVASGYHSCGEHRWSRPSSSVLSLKIALIIWGIGGRFPCSVYFV